MNAPDHELDMIRASAVAADDDLDRGRGRERLAKPRAEHGAVVDRRRVRELKPREERVELGVVYRTRTGGRNDRS